MNVVFDNITLRGDGQEVVAVPPGLQRHEQSIQSEGCHCGEGELRR